jgi:DNA-directed RNA polymerase subunit RPC12/RpoP
MKTKTVINRIIASKVKQQENRTITYHCMWCNAVFKIQDLNFDYTEAIYCPNCGNDTLKEHE